MRTLSDPIPHAKSKKVGCRPSEPLDSLIGGVWEGPNTVCALVFHALCSVISCFHVLKYWHETSCYYVHSGQIILCSRLKERFFSFSCKWTAEFRPEELALLCCAICLWRGCFVSPIIQICAVLAALNRINYITLCMPG